MLVLASLFSKEFHFLEEEYEFTGTLHRIKRHPRKHEFHIKYHDKLKGKDVLIKANQLKDIEKESILVFKGKGNKEYFLPIHRVRNVLHKGKPVK